VDDIAVPFCIGCGLELQGEHRFCPRCGAERWTPPGEAPANRPPPGAGTQPFAPVTIRRTPTTGLRWLPFVFAAGAVFWLVQVVQFSAIALAPAGRDQLRQALVQAGVTADLSTYLVVQVALVFLVEGVAVALHAGAYFGLRARKPWGWITAVIVAAAWSLVLIGIPILVVLLRRTTRTAYGIS
jgi:hypothetical protein